MKTRYTLIPGLLALALAAACSAPAPSSNAPAEPDVPAAAPDAAAPESAETAPPEGEAMVQPEWDGLDRVQDTCGMSAVRGFLGRAASEIPAERLPEQVRILAPTDQATMDYVPRRLNVLTDEDGTVIGFKCG